MKAIGGASLLTPGSRAYFYELHDELKSKGIYAGVLTISVLIDKHHAEKIAALLLDMYQKRDRVEDLYGDDVELLRQISNLSQRAVNEFKWPESMPLK